MPIRLNGASERIFFHEVEVTTYPLFDHPPYTLALATKMAEVAEVGIARSAARPLRHSALGQRAAGAHDGRAEEACRSSPRCTAPISRSSATIAAICRSRVSRSSRATASRPFRIICATAPQRIRNQAADRRDPEFRQLRSLQAPGRRRQPARTGRLTANPS